MQAPELPSNLIPTIGQQFRTLDEAFNFYNAYAKHAGFGIKKARTTNIGAICDVSERVSTNQLLMKANGSGTGQAGKQVAKHV